MFKRDDIPDQVKYFEVVLKRSGVAIDLEMIKESSGFYIHVVGSDKIDQIENC